MASEKAFTTECTEEHGGKHRERLSANNEPLEAEPELYVNNSLNSRGL
jgi:hypothetical protein